MTQLNKLAFVLQKKSTVKFKENGSENGSIWSRNDW